MGTVVHDSGFKKKSSTLQNLIKLDYETDSILCSTDIISTISNCTQVFTFTNPLESPSQQDHKRRGLLFLLSTLCASKTSIYDHIISPLISMISINLFHSVRRTGYTCYFLLDDYEDDPSTMNLLPSWPHLQIIYDILALLVARLDTSTLRSHFDRSFLSNILNLFQSEDPRERERLKNIYHALYSKITSQRSFMRRSMGSLFLNFIIDQQSNKKHCGIGELLEVYGSIINGFTIPLKEEHKAFLVRVLMPLHKVRAVYTYHRQLSYCVTQFIEKDSSLSMVVLKKLLRYWPVTNCPKEVLFLGEIEDIVEAMEVHDFQMVATTLCYQIAICLTSCSSQVAERALYIWNNENFVRMASRCMQDILPAIVHAIEKNIDWHWNKSVQSLSVTIKKVIQEMEPKLYAKCIQDLQLRELVAAEEEKRRKEMWEKLECLDCICL